MRPIRARSPLKRMKPLSDVEYLAADDLSRSVNRPDMVWFKLIVLKIAPYCSKLGPDSQPAGAEQMNSKTPATQAQFGAVCGAQVSDCFPSHLLYAS